MLKPRALGVAGSRNPNSVFGTGCPPFCLFTLAPCVSAVFPGEPPAWQAPGSLFTGIPQPAGSCVVSPLLKPHSGQAWAATVVGPVNSGSCPRRWSTPPPPPRDPPHWLGKGWGRHGLCGEELEVWDISRSWRGLELEGGLDLGPAGHPQRWREAVVKLLVCLGGTGLAGGW